MKKVLGGKDGVCPHCGGMMIYIKIKNQVFSNCKNCGALTHGRERDEIKIYTFEEVKS